jgi:anionic cell wall polymer biosynthesis LytR-Cps2A-Psr (LCP) family protein
VNDRQDPYGQQAPGNAEFYGYDEYGRPVYRPAPAPPQAPPDGYGYGAGPQQTGQQPTYGEYDYGTGAQAPVQGDYGGGYDGYDYGTGEQRPVPPGYPDAGHTATHEGHQGYDHGTGEQPPVYPGYGPDTGEQARVPSAAPAAPPAPAPPDAANVPGQRRPPEAGGNYDTDEFSFVEESDQDSQDVIDWLKFTESRTERREEAKRRGRSRRRLLVVTLVLALLGGAGYLWATDRMPFLPGTETGTEGGSAAEVRDVIAVHLRETNGDTTSTALLVANETTERGTTLLLPNELAVTPDGTATTLGQAVTESSAGEVRDALGGLLGADIKGTWRLDTPYLDFLVELVGGITVDTNVEVPAGAGAGGDGEGEGDGQGDGDGGGDGEGGDEGGGEPLVPQGNGVTMDGEAAIGYATYRAEGEPESAQLERFGQVMAGVLENLSSNERTVTETLQALNQIPDPSLSQEELGASLAQLAGYAQSDAYETTLLPVEDGGLISDDTAGGLVRDVLGGTVADQEAGGVARIGIRDASGVEGTAEDARIALINGGFTVVDARAVEEIRSTSQVTYGDAEYRETAVEVARTLGLPEDAVTEGESAGSSNVTIVLGEDFVE